MRLTPPQLVSFFRSTGWSAGASAARGRPAIASLVLALVLPWSPPIRAAAAPQDIFEGKSFGELAAEQMENAFRSAAELSSHKAELATYIEQARRSYFAVYPGGSDVGAAARAFEEALFTKDIFYLNFALPAGIDAPQARLVLGLGGQVDGGIPERAMPSFREIVKAMRRDFGAKGEDDLVFIPSLSGFLESMRGNGEIWSTYTMQRTYHEHLRARKPMPGSEDPRVYVQIMLQVDGRSRSPLDDYRALRGALGEDVLHDVARRVRELPVDAKGLLGDASPVGVKLLDGDVLPAGLRLEPGQIPVLGRTPLDVMKALWRKASPRADALLSMARREWPDLASAWSDYQEIEAALGYPASLTAVALALARQEPRAWQEAVADYRILARYVDADLMGEAAIAYAAVPKLRYGGIGDLAPLGLLTPEEALAAGIEELISFKAPDGRGVAFDLRPIGILSAIWQQDNPRAYALLTAADLRDPSFARAQAILDGLAAAVGEEVASEVWRRFHAEPRSAARIDLREWDRVVASFLEAGDARSDIRFFIATQTGAVDAAAIDAKYGELAALAGEQALLAAAERLAAADWDLAKAGEAGSSILGALEQMVAGGGTSSLSYRQWADCGPGSLVTFDVVLETSRGISTYLLQHVNSREAMVQRLDRRAAPGVSSIAGVGGGSLPRVLETRCRPCRGACADLPYLPSPHGLPGMQAVRETSEELLEVMGRTLRCRRELRSSDELNARGRPKQSLEIWTSDEVPGKVAKVVDGSRTATVTSYVRVDGLEYDGAHARLASGSDAVRTLSALAGGAEGPNAAATACTLLARLAMDGEVQASAIVETLRATADGETAAARAACRALAELIVAGKIPGGPPQAMDYFERAGDRYTLLVWSTVNAGIAANRCTYNVNPRALAAVDLVECGAPSVAWLRAHSERLDKNVYVAHCAEHLEARKKDYGKGGSGERFFEVLDDETARKRLWEEDL